jgi:hypothetical protein
MVTDGIRLRAKRRIEMAGRRILRALAALSALALIPVVWMQGAVDLPSMSEVVAAKTADTIGVWVFTWSLIVVASIAALGVAWAAWSWDRETSRVEDVQKIA